MRYKLKLVYDDYMEDVLACYGRAELDASIANPVPGCVYIAWCTFAYEEEGEDHVVLDRRREVFGPQMTVFESDEHYS